MQFARTCINAFDRFVRIAMMRDRGESRLKQQVQLSSISSQIFGQLHQSVERIAVVLDCLRECRPLGRYMAGALPIGDRAIIKRCFCQMMSQHLRMGLNCRQKMQFERPRNLGMKLLAAAPQEGLIGRILNERVLEDVDRLGRLAAAEQQLGGDQLVERGLELRLRPVGDCGEERVRELAADRGGSLGDLLDRGEAVEAGE